VPNKPWKDEERKAAALFDAVRFPANSGARIDFEGPRFLGQVKHRKALSMPEIERLAEEVESIGFNAGKLGVVVTHRRAGSGTRTSRLITMTEAVWKRIKEAIKP
jgi:hypothetical protein